MLRRAVRTLFSLLLIPALTGVGTSCTMMTMGSLVHAVAVAAGTNPSQSAGTRCDEGTSVPTGSSQQTPHHGSTGANCCPVIAGCGAVGLPSQIPAPSETLAIVASTQMAFVQMPIAWSAAPEPPPPKA